MINLMMKMLAKLTGAYNKDPESVIGRLFQIFAMGLWGVEDTLQVIAVWRDIDAAKGYSLTDPYIIGYAVPKYADSKEVIEMSKEELVALIRQIIREENPVYVDLENVPASWKDQTKALLDAGAVNGGTDADTCATDLNLNKDTLKAAIIAARYCDAKTGTK